MRIVYFGSGRFGIPCLEAILDSGHQLTGVFTQPARPAGRHRDLKPTDVALWCKEKDISCFEADDINAPEWIEKVKQFGGDLLVVIAFGQKISQSLIRLFPKGAINVHGSLLPKYRGAAPINWAIIRGESETGVSIITLADRMDAGQILAQTKTPITPNDNFQTLHDRMADISAPILVNTIDAIYKGIAVYQPQDDKLATKAPKLKKEHGFVDWKKSAIEIVNQVRGLWPSPGATAVYVSARTGKSWKITIAKSCVVDGNNLKNEVCGILDENFHISCGQGMLHILELKPAGSGLMDFRSFVNGRQGGAGDLFLPMDMVLRDFI
jgi:methionyl-tRNA formyltransferase